MLFRSLIATFVKMRVWPLRARAHPMWEYEGALDATRMSKEELSKNELVSHVRSITSTKSSEPCNVDCPVDPYGAEKPLPEVSESIEFMISCFCYFAMHLCDFRLLYVVCRATRPPQPFLLFLKMAQLMKQR